LDGLIELIGFKKEELIGCFDILLMTAVEILSNHSRSPRKRAGDSIGVPEGHHGSKNGVVRQHQSLELRQRSRKHHAP